jgi:hypothetical protein
MTKNSVELSFQSDSFTHTGAHRSGRVELPLADALPYLEIFVPLLSQSHGFAGAGGGRTSSRLRVELPAAHEASQKRVSPQH